MTNDIAIIQTALDSVRAILAEPFWRRFDFWLSFIASAGGVVFSIMAFSEARKAKRAATEAGRIVKIQTVAIELTEIAQKLGSMDTNIQFNEARDLLAELSRRLRRAISAFAKDPDLGDTIAALRDALTTAKKSLNSVRPADPSKEKDVPHAVYYAVESDFATINDLVADLLGLFERKSINMGDEDAKT